MRVLWWVHSFYPMINGVQIVGAELALGLAALGHEIEIIASQETSLAPYDEFQGIPIHRFPFFQALESRDPERIHAVRRGIEERMDRFRPDLIHLHITDYPALFCAMTLGHRPTPLIATRHQLFAEQRTGRDTLPDRLLSRAAWIACCSRAVLEETLREIPGVADRTSVILNGLAPPPLPPTPLPAGPVRFLCLGRSVRQKGFDLAIQAFARIFLRFPGSELRIAGDGVELGSLREEASRLGMEAAVQFPGWIPPTSVPAEIAASTAVMVPSRAGEGFCLVALQAAQMARPVVATRVGGLPEVVVDRETGLLVEPEDVEELAGALLELAANRALATELGRAARERALKLFHGDRYRDQYEDLYQRHQGARA